MIVYMKYTLFPAPPCRNKDSVNEQRVFESCANIKKLKFSFLQ